MRILEVREENDFRGMMAQWDALTQESDATVFVSWEWVTAWWRVYGNAAGLRIFAAFDDDGVLRGVAPLRSGAIHRYGQNVPSWSFVGDGSNDSDYLDLILFPGWEQRAVEAFWHHWEREFRDGTVLQLNEIPSNSAALPALKQIAEDRRFLWVESPVACASVRLPESWDAYLGSLRPRFRTKVRSVLRALESNTAVQFGFSESLEETQKILPDLFDLHTRRWAAEGKPGVFGPSKKRAFYLELSRVLHERGWLRLSWVKWNGRILACQYGFVFKGVYSQLQEGYEPAAEHLSPGIALRAWSIRELLRQDVREYDFLGGVKRNKTDWGAEIKYSEQILIAHDSWKNRLVCRGPGWEERMRNTVKSALPGKALKVISTLRRGPAQAALSVRHWARAAAANCYIHSPAPRFLTPLRNRYEIGTGSPGWKPRFQKRQQPVARILYYHRVNNEGDPFFPSMPTAAFERTMQYVARHYRVVSVAEMLDQLHHGPPEPLVAITFDDGYQDNYENAFPVLQRYGLPATIFLTTGSLDSRQPLWFEELADALKRTEKELVEVDIDFPRRIPLRTPEERLRANGELFQLLRAMSNGERKTRLCEVLRQIGAPDSAERSGRMLTWEQVREMKKGGIEFGGHTVTHPFVSRLTSEEAQWEMAECKRRIEDELQDHVDYFAYPNGREEDFGQWNKQVLATAGYKAAMTTIWGLNDASTDPMELRRGGPWEEDHALFASKLDWYQWANQ
jgi:peptidoglycan/xylan/chitin deacetylase (PgdA/CDA1 family)/CelD/BcsL family acetyltransferase involved in cellulose biosynthesis